MDRATSNLWTVPDVLRNLRDGDISLGRALELIRPYLKESTATNDVPWSCGNCGHLFQEGVAFFDPQRGIVCPQCKSTDCGPQTANN
jgi:predicted Zn-ribbon and HTH transcriptional regulator